MALPTYLYTICIALNHFAFGISSNIVWPSLVDLTAIYGTTSETMSYAGTFSSFGYLIGSLSGCLYQWINRQFTLTIMVTLIAVTTAMMPHYKYLALFFICMVFNGTGGGSWDSSNNIWLVEMWPEHNGPVMQFTQFMYGLGTIVGPIMISPYVHGDDNSTVTANITAEERETELTKPFALAGVIQIIVPIMFIILFCTKLRYKKKGVVVGMNDEAVANLHQAIPQIQDPYRKWKLLLAALMLATYDAAELGYFFYSPTMWQYVEDKLSATEAAHVSSVLSATYTAGRLLTALVSLKIKSHIILFYHFVIIVIAQVILFVGQHNLNVIYGATALLGYGFSAMWPAILAFTDRHLKLSNKVGSLMFAFAGLVTLFTPLMIGSYLETKPLVLFVFEAGYLALFISLFVILGLFILRTRP